MTKRRLVYLSAFAVFIILFALLSQTLSKRHLERVQADQALIAEQEAQEGAAEEANAQFEELQSKLIAQSWGPENLKVVFLTFDGGPADSSEEVLNILKQNNVKATFFTDGHMSENAAAIYRRIVSEGHTLANEAGSDFDSETYINGINAVLKQETDITGAEPVKVFRFVGGSDLADQEAIDALVGAGYGYYDWNVDIPEGSELSSDEAFKQIIDGVHSNSVSVVRLSSEYPSENGSREALDSAIKQLQSEGYQFMTLDPVYSFFRFAQPSGTTAPANGDGQGETPATAVPADPTGTEEGNATESANPDATDAVQEEDSESNGDY